MRKPVRLLAHLPLGVVLSSGALVLGLSEEPSAHTSGGFASGAISHPVTVTHTLPSSLGSALQFSDNSRPAMLSAAASVALKRLHATAPTGSPADMALALSADALPLDEEDYLDGFSVQLATFDPAIEGLSSLTDLPPELVLTQLLVAAEGRKALAKRSDATATIDPPSDLVSVFGKDSKASQARLVNWLSRFYRRDRDDVLRFVRYAWDSGARNGVDPLLIVAVMSIESSLNPKAVSHKGAKGLMQVLVAAHEEKFDPFGGRHQAKHPRVSVEVGTRILRGMIDRTGTVEGALKHYVGARYFKSDGGYGAKVITMRERIWAASMGYTIPVKPALASAIAHANNAQAAVADHIHTAQR